MRRKLVAKGKKKILDIGSGGNPYQTDEGTVITVDIREDVKPDYVCDVRCLPFETGHFDIVFSSHTLEHFGRNEFDAVLDEWLRVLKPDGELRIVLPNIAWAAEQIGNGIINNDVLNVLYGQQEYRENFHRMGYTPEMLRQMLEGRGFKITDMHLDGYNILCKASKKKAKSKRK